MAGASSNAKFRIQGTGNLIALVSGLSCESGPQPGKSEARPMDPHESLGSNVGFTPNVSQCSFVSLHDKVWQIGVYTMSKQARSNNIKQPHQLGQSPTFKNGPTVPPSFNNLAPHLQKMSLQCLDAPQSATEIHGAGTSPERKPNSKPHAKTAKRKRMDSKDGLTDRETVEISPLVSRMARPCTGPETRPLAKTTMANGMVAPGSAWMKEMKETCWKVLSREKHR